MKAGGDAADAAEGVAEAVIDSGKSDEEAEIEGADAAVEAGGDDADAARGVNSAMLRKGRSQEEATAGAEKASMQVKRGNTRRKGQLQGPWSTPAPHWLPGRLALPLTWNTAASSISHPTNASTEH